MLICGVMVGLFPQVSTLVANTSFNLAFAASEATVCVGFFVASLFGAARS